MKGPVATQTVFQSTFLTLSCVVSLFSRPQPSCPVGCAEGSWQRLVLFVTWYSHTHFPVLSASVATGSFPIFNKPHKA